MKLFFLGILFFVRFVFAQELAPINNGFGGGGDPSQVFISVIDQSKANELFRKFVQNKEIPFKYPIDGCYARAHEMARMAEREKTLMGKIFVEGDLQVKIQSKNWGSDFRWGFHVAPIAFVKRSNGKTELMVFDPTLFGRPATVSEWKQKMLVSTNGFKARIRYTYYGARFQYLKNTENYKTEWSQSDLEHVKATFEKYFPLQDLPISATGRAVLPSPAKEAR